MMPDPDPRAVAAKQRAIDALGSQVKLANAIGLSQAGVGKWPVVPERWMSAVSDATGIAEAELRPDLFENGAKVRTELVHRKGMVSPPSGPEFERLRKILRDIISAAGRQEALAKSIGTTQATISRWEIVPEGWVGKVSAATRLTPHQIRPDLFDANGRLRTAASSALSLAPADAPPPSSPLPFDQELQQKIDARRAEIQTLEERLVVARRELSALQIAFDTFANPDTVTA
jgi:DNA-binding transcriptional regulator YdaS (Cro superfamily)